MHDYSNTKAKILATLKNVDEFKSGLVRYEVFSKLVNGMGIDLAAEDEKKLRKRYGLSYNGQNFVKYESILRAIKYDNHNEQWMVSNMANLKLAPVDTAKLDQQKVLSTYNLQ